MRDVLSVTSMRVVLSASSFKSSSVFLAHFFFLKKKRVGVQVNSINMVCETTLNKRSLPTIPSNEFSTSLVRKRSRR